MEPWVIALMVWFWFRGFKSVIMVIFQGELEPPCFWYGQRLADSLIWDRYDPESRNRIYGDSKVLCDYTDLENFSVSFEVKFQPFLKDSEKRHNFLSGSNSNKSKRYLHDQSIGHLSEWQVDYSWKAKMRVQI